MGKRLTQIRDFAAYISVLVFWQSVRIFPYFLVRFNGCWAGWTLYYLVPGTRRLVRANIRAAMPELGDAEVSRIGRRSCCHLCRNLLEFFWLSGSPKRIEQRYYLPEPITAELKSHVAAGERIIFVNPHLGSWEASGLMAPHYAGVDMVAIAKPMRNPYLNRLITRDREQTKGLRIIFSRGAMKASLQALRDGFGVGTLIDQNTKAREGGIFVDFFGLPVASSPAPASLMHYCQLKAIPAVIIYGSCVRMPDGRVQAHSAYLSKPFEEYASEAEVIQELMDISERHIRQFPDQYLWFYKRFAHIPPDCPEELQRRYPYYAAVAGPGFFGKK